MQLFRQRFYHKNMKVSATMLIGVIGSNSLALHDCGSQYFSKKEGQGMNTHVSAVFFCHTETP